jgi:HEAT repeat protein
MSLTEEAARTSRKTEPEALIARLKALYDADRATLELTALGPRAIPPLKKFLFQREPSGLYESRVNAVFALRALKAEDVLLEFLHNAPEVDIADPVERTGEDAVINAAARALAHRRDDEVFRALIGIAEWRSLPGVIEALGEMRRKSAIPFLIAGLASDFCRGTAEIALTKIGAAARPALIELALNPIPSVEFETVSSIRTRRSAVSVLCDVGVTLEQWSVLQPLMWSSDERLSALTCSLGLNPGHPSLDREIAIRRIFRLLRSSGWLLTIEIENWLVENYDVTSRVIVEAIERGDGVLEDKKVRHSLLQVTARIASTSLSREFPKSNDAG